MGLFSMIKRQMLKVVEWTDDTSDTIVYKFPMSDRYAVMKGTQLIVRESQKAIFVNEGKIADIYEPGRYSLDTENTPVLTALKNWKYAFETPFTGDIYFINTKQFAGLKWGTQNPVMMRDKDFGMIRLRGFGTYSFKVERVDILLKELFGTMRSFKTEDIHNHLKKLIVSKLSDAIAESGIPALDLAMKYDEIGVFARQQLQERFSALGFLLTDVVIENLSLPEEVEKTMDTRTSMGVLGDKMGTFTQYQGAMAMRDAANNEGGAAGAGMGIGAGFGFGNVMANSVAQSVASAKDEEKKIVCPTCKKEINAGAKFCPECGGRVGEPTEKCAKCGLDIPKGAKFCPNCGEKTEKVCAKCGKTLGASDKFCPECGEKA